MTLKTLSNAAVSNAIALDTLVAFNAVSISNLTQLGHFVTALDDFGRVSNAIGPFWTALDTRFQVQNLTQRVGGAPFGCVRPRARTREG